MEHISFSDADYGAKKKVTRHEKLMAIKEQLQQKGQKQRNDSQSLIDLFRVSLSNFQSVNHFDHIH